MPAMRTSKQPMTGPRNMDVNENKQTRERTRHISSSSSSSSHSGSLNPGDPLTSELTPIPPDGGWGWVVTFSSFMIGVIVDGICFTFGFFFQEFMDHFGSNKSITSSISSVLNGSYMIVGPIIGGLVNVFGCRKVAIFGSILSSVAFFCSTFSPTVEVMIFVYGFIGGIGFGCMYLPAIVMVGYYFDKKRALATGMAVCGSGIGSFVFSPMCEFLLARYGWKGAMWIISGLVLNGAVFASLYRPLNFTEAGPQPKPEREPEQQGCATTEEITIVTETKDHSSSNVVNNKTSTMVTANTDSSRVLSIGTRKPAESAPVLLNPIYRCKSLELNLSSDLKENQDMARLARSQMLSPTFSSEYHHGTHKHGHRLVLSPLDRKDIFYGGSVTRLPEYKEAGSEANYVRSMLSMGSSRMSELKTFGRRSIFKALCSKQLLLSVFDFSLLRRPSFVIYCISCFLCMMGFFIPFTYMPALARDLGMSPGQSTWLISTIGILNTGGRILVGYVSDKTWSDSLLINNVCLVVGGIFTMFVPFYTFYWLLIVYAVVFGTAIAAFVSLRSIIIVELLGVEKLTSSFGLVVLCQGLSSFIGSPIAGALSDHTGDYKASFYLAGATIALAGVICLPLRRISAWEKRTLFRDQRKVVGDVTDPMLQDLDDVEQNGIFVPQKEVL